MWQKEVRTNEQTNKRTYEWKDENYIPVSINGGYRNVYIFQNMLIKILAIYMIQGYILDDNLHTF